MALDAKALRVEFATGVTGASADGKLFFRQASYVTPDLAAVVEAAGYFNGAAARLPKGTVITAVMDQAGTPNLKSYVVTANTGTVVTVALQTTAAG